MNHDNGKQNPEEFYMSKYQKHVACSYSYKLVCVHDNYSNYFKSYLGEDGVYNFIMVWLKKVNIVLAWWRNIFTKKLVMTEEGDEYFGNSPKCWICDNIYADGDVKTKIHCHIFGKYRSSAYRDCNTNVKLNHKIPIVF